MPIIVPEQLDDPLRQQLLEERVPIIGHADAEHQDMRPARIGLLNLMPAPAMHSTEFQWLRHMGNTILQIDPVLMKFNHDPREGGSSGAILERYIPFDEAVVTPLDALIVTGANQELDKDTLAEQPLHGINYAAQLRDVLDYAYEQVPYSIFSCLGAHFTLNYRYGVERTIGDRKTFGVYDHQRTAAGRASPLTGNMNDTIRAPHSRWGNIATEDLMQLGGVSLLAANADIGWLLAEAPNKAGGTDLYTQGHPEYQRYDLHGEYSRDADSGQRPPEGYYRGNPAVENIDLSWVSDARALHSNWISAVYGHLSGVAA